MRTSGLESSRAIVEAKIVIETDPETARFRGVIGVARTAGESVVKDEVIVPNTVVGEDVTPFAGTVSTTDPENKADDMDRGPLRPLELPDDPPRVEPPFVLIETLDSDVQAELSPEELVICTPRVAAALGLPMGRNAPPTTVTLVEPVDMELNLTMEEIRTASPENAKDSVERYLGGDNDDGERREEDEATVTTSKPEEKDRVSPADMAGILDLTAEDEIHPLATVDVLPALNRLEPPPMMPAPRIVNDVEPVGGTFIVMSVLLVVVVGGRGASEVRRGESKLKASEIVDMA